RRSKTRSECPRIIAGERTIAAARPAALEDHGAGQAACCRIRRRRRELCKTAVLFFEVRLKVVPQTIIESQFSGDLPCILSKSRERVFAETYCVRRRDPDLVHQAQKETRVWEADGTTIEGSSQLRYIRKTGLRSGERVNAARVGVDGRCITFDAGFTA